MTVECVSSRLTPCSGTVSWGSGHGTDTDRDNKWKTTQQAEFSDKGRRQSYVHLGRHVIVRRYPQLQLQCVCVLLSPCLRQCACGQLNSSRSSWTADFLRWVNDVYSQPRSFTDTLTNTPRLHKQTLGRQSQQVFRYHMQAQKNTSCAVCSPLTMPACSGSAVAPDAHAWLSYLTLATATYCNGSTCEELHRLTPNDPLFFLLDWVQEYKQLALSLCCLLHGLLTKLDYGSKKAKH